MRSCSAKPFSILSEVMTNVSSRSRLSTDELSYDYKQYQTHPTSCFAQRGRCRQDEGYRYNCTPPSRRPTRTPRDTPAGQLCCEYQDWRLRTCKTLSALRMSPRDNFNRAAFPSSVKLTLFISLKHRGGDDSTYCSFSTTSSTFFSTSFSGNGEKRNLVHRDWIAGVILLT